MTLRLVLMLILVQACSPGTPMVPTQTTAPETGPAVILPNGSMIRVEIAADDDTRAQGLMYRESVAEDRGMLFLFRDSAMRPFWMKNTLVPLDIIWIDDGFRIVDISAQTPPCRTDPCPSYPPKGQSRFVLELAGGQAAARGLKIGDTVQFRDVNLSVAR